MRKTRLDCLCPAAKFLHELSLLGQFLAVQKREKHEKLCGCLSLMKCSEFRGESNT